MAVGDGQAYGALAQDPTLARPEVFSGGANTAAYRYQRPVLGYLAWAASLGRPEWEPNAQGLLVVLGAAAAAAACAELLRRRGHNPLLALVVLLAPGMLSALQTLTAEPIALAFLTLGLLLWWDDPRRATLAAVCFSLAALTRESSLVAVAAIRCGRGDAPSASPTCPTWLVAPARCTAGRAVRGLPRVDHAAAGAIGCVADLRAWRAAVSGTVRRSRPRHVGVRQSAVYVVLARGGCAAGGVHLRAARRPVTCLGSGLRALRGGARNGGVAPLARLRPPTPAPLRIRTAHRDDTDLPPRPGAGVTNADPDAWERNAAWWQEGFTDGADPEYEEQILPLAAECLAGARRVVDVGTGEGQVARLAHRLGAEVVVGVDPTRGAAPGRGGARRRAALPARRRRASAVRGCELRRRDRVPGVRAPARARTADRRDRARARARRALRVPAQPSVAPGAQQRLGDRRRSSASSTGGSGSYLPVDVTMEELAPGVSLPFVHRPLSQYVNAMAAVGLLIRAHGGAPPARGLPRQSRRVPRRRRHPPPAPPVGREAPLTHRTGVS